MTDLKNTPTGRQRPVRDSISIDHLYLDPENPRLPVSAQRGKQSELLRVLYKEFNLGALADSLTKNGYFTEEPLVCIPQRLNKRLSKRLCDYTDKERGQFGESVQADDTDFTVVEGNRRLATCKLLVSMELRKTLGVRSWPELSPDIEADLSSLPAIIYPIRDEVVPYLGVRHIAGIQKWESYAKARYIAGLVSDGTPFEEVEAQIGDKKGSARRNYVAFKMLTQLEQEFDFDTRKATEDFSLLVLAIGQRGIKQFLGIPKTLASADSNAPIPEDRLENLRDLVSWLFGDEKHKNPAIQESRDITKYLKHVVSSEEAVKYLRTKRNLIEAYDRSDGEEMMLLKYIQLATSKLETALGIAHLHKTADVVASSERCHKTATQLIKNVTAKDD